MAATGAAAVVVGIATGLLRRGGGMLPARRHARRHHAAAARLRRLPRLLPARRRGLADGLVTVTVALGIGLALAAGVAFGDFVARPRRRRLGLRASRRNSAPAGRPQRPRRLGACAERTRRNMPSGIAKSAEFVVVANRLPVDLEKLPDGTQRWKRSPGGLVTALEPMLRSREGAWVGWPGLADADVEPLVEDGLQLHPVRLSAAGGRGLLRGLLQRHPVAALPRRRRPAGVPPALVAGLRAGQPAVRRGRGRGRGARAPRSGCRTTSCSWCPAVLRELRPDLRIGFFLHIPFPPTELFMQLPWRRRIVEGLLGADLVGFHTPGGARNFRWLATRLAGASPGRGRNEVALGDRTVKLGRVPDLHRLERRSTSCRAAPRCRSGPSRSAPTSATRSSVVLGVDRLDYTKGIDVRLRAFEELLAEDRVDAEDTVMVQIATPSRERVEHYQQDAQRHRAGGRADQRRVRPRRPPCRALPAPVAARATSWPRSSWPPTSCW